MREQASARVRERGWREREGGGSKGGWERGRAKAERSKGGWMDEREEWRKGWREGGSEGGREGGGRERDKERK